MFLVLRRTYHLRLTTQLNQHIGVVRKVSKKKKLKRTGN